MYFELNNGNKMPKVGLGTWQLNDKDVLFKALKTGLENGYYLIDTASEYENESEIGEFLSSHLPQNISRNNIFITSKLWSDDHDNPRKACEESLRKLKIDYLDLYLIHWPVNTKGKFDLEFVWKEMEKLVDEGKVKSIGVSNFGLKNLTHLMKFFRIKPVVNQIELHPYLPQTEIKDFCKKNDILIISYSTLGSSQPSKCQIPLLKNPTITNIAKKYNSSPSQIILSYVVQEGCAVIPRSSSPEHIKENIKLIKLSDSDVQEINNIQIRYRFNEHIEIGKERFD